jgi:iron complex transport system substrate-binding protein
MSRSIDEISAEIVDAAYKLHTAIGPGLLESAYESLLARGLEKRGLKVERQKLVSFDYDGQRVTDGLRIDLLVENIVVVEIKAVERLLQVHTKQVVTYLRVLNLQVALLINFDGATLKEGLRRVVNGYKPPHFSGRLPQPNDSQPP